MSDFVVPAGLTIIGVAVYLAWKQGSAPADAPAQDLGAGFNLGDYVPGFLEGFTSTEPPAAPVENWSGEVYTQADIEGVPVEGDSQLPGVVDSIITNTMDLGFMNTSTSADMGNANVRAFLDMIAVAEGTDGPEGYRVMFGYPRFQDRLITSYADHPRQYFSFTAGGRTQKTSAAGRYQFLVGTWDELKKKLGLQDFSPASQDAACIELIRQRRALDDVRAGRVASAITKCAKTWASLPGAGYGQPEQAMGKLLYAYRQAGGTTLEA